MLEKEHRADTVYIASEEAMVDVLSIAPKAGNERNPILISGKDSMSQNNINWIKERNIKNIYFIGGPNVLSDKVVNQVAKATGLDLSHNRFFGSNRIETNSKIIDKLYNEKFSLKAFVTRSDAPIDAITVSAFAQKTNSPVILAGNSVSSYQRNVLEPRSASLVYKVGGGINQNSYNQIYNLLGGIMKN